MSSRIRSPSPPPLRRHTPPSEGSPRSTTGHRRRRDDEDDDGVPWWEEDRRGGGASTSSRRDERSSTARFSPSAEKKPRFDERRDDSRNGRSGRDDHRDSRGGGSGGGGRDSYGEQRGSIRDRGGYSGNNDRRSYHNDTSSHAGNSNGRSGPHAYNNNNHNNSQSYRNGPPPNGSRREEREAPLNYSDAPPPPPSRPHPPTGPRSSIIPSPPKSLPPVVQDAPINFEPEVEVDIEQLMAEKRRKRAEILAKYSTAAAISDNGSGAGTPVAVQTGDVVQVQIDTPGRKGVEKDTSKLRIDSVPPPTVDNDTFELTKDLNSNEAIRIGEFLAAQEGEIEMSAADYNPDADRKEDDRRRAEREGGVVPVEVSHPVVGMKKETVVEEEDDDDMFSIGLKPVVVNDDDVVAPGFVPVIDRSLDASGLTDNFDDEEGYYKLILGELLDNGRYHVRANLGKGMFSGVVRALDTESKTGEEVAIKVIRSQESMHKAGLKEAGILRKLQEADPDDKKHLIRLHRTFEHRGHLCLVFESLSMNLREVVKRFGKDVGINIKAVRAYASQMFLGLALLRKCDIMHADIKPDNILVNESKSVLKICDLGSASDISENDITPYLVSRFYRAPEIILGLPYDFNLDTWSIGCTLYELYTGKILFPGRTNNHMLYLMMELKGKFGHKIIKKAKFGDQHFDESVNFILTEKTDTKRLVSISSKATHDLKSRLMSPTAIKKLKEDEVRILGQFVDLLDKMLSLEPGKRPSPKDLLNHPFLRG